MNTEFKFSKSAIEWRRNTVLQKLSQGWSQGEIAKELQLHPSTISLDCQWIRETSRENLKTFMDKRLPEEFEKAITSYDYIIRTASHTADTTQDERIKIEALKVVRDTRTAKMDLISNVDVMNYQRTKDLRSLKADQEAGEETPEQHQEEELEHENSH